MRQSPNIAEAEKAWGVIGGDDKARFRRRQVQVQVQVQYNEGLYGSCVTLKLWARQVGVWSKKTKSRLTYLNEGHACSAGGRSLGLFFGLGGPALPTWTDVSARKHGMAKGRPHAACSLAFVHPRCFPLRVVHGCCYTVLASPPLVCRSLPTVPALHSTAPAAQSLLSRCRQALRHHHQQQSAYTHDAFARPCPRPTASPTSFRSLAQCSISGTAPQKPSCSRPRRNTPAQSRFVSDRERRHDVHIAPVPSQPEASRLAHLRLIQPTLPPRALPSLVASALVAATSTARHSTRDVIRHGLRDQVPRGLGRR